MLAKYTVSSGRVFFSFTLDYKNAIAQKRLHNEVILTLKGYLKACANDCIACNEQADSNKISPELR
ncbi:MAG: hypothetical protein HGA59_07365 [Chlorobiaceae bacterium]|jgi:hypothetical protein|nr:hypothetical protein [Chlorobiaceae bacterium]